MSFLKLGNEIIKLVKNNFHIFTTETTDDVIHNEIYSKETIF